MWLVWSVPPILPGSASEPGMTETGPILKVLSYNVHGLSDDRDALTSVVRTLAPDLVFVQEAPRRFRWRTRSASMAHSFGMLYAAGGLPSLGNVIVTSHRVRVHETWCLRYPLTPGRHMRGAAFARCSLLGTAFVAVASHLATDDTERPAQAQLLKAAMTGLDAPVIFGGDLNDIPASESWKLLGDGLVDAGAAEDAPTYPVPRASRRIDAIMVDPRCRIERFEVVDSPAVRLASDHFPIVSDIALPVIT
jgi:endonuclease/exonuclease/phosphatase family metal-dependent hydrolase